MSEIDPELAEICRLEHPRLVGALALYVGDRHVAEQLAQEALTKLFQHWPRVRGTANPRAWLHGVAMNLARSWWRRWYAERRALIRHGVDVAPDQPDPADAIAVRRAVARLPDRQRRALVLRHYAGLSVAETATEMRCAEGTVKALTSHAIDSLRSQLREPLTEEISDDRRSRTAGPHHTERAPSP